MPERPPVSLSTPPLIPSLTLFTIAVGEGRSGSLSVIGFNGMVTISFAAPITCKGAFTAAEAMVVPNFAVSPITSPDIAIGVPIAAMTARAAVFVDEVICLMAADGSSAILLTTSFPLPKISTMESLIAVNLSRTPIL